MTHEDEKQLRLLSQLHYLGAALASVIPLFGAGYGALGISILIGKVPLAPATPSHALGWFPLTIGVFVALFGVTAVGLNVVSARSLRDRKNRTLCLITSAINSMHFPLGTLLGIFTIVVLCRPAVSAAFQARGGGSEPTRPKPEFEREREEEAAPPSSTPVTPVATGIGGKG